MNRLLLSYALFLCISTGMKGQGPASAGLVNSRAPNVKAIVVAVSEYGSKIPGTDKHKYDQPLFTTTAESFAKYLETIPEITTVVRCYNSDATRDKILQFVSEEPERGVPSLLIFYFCGHGLKVPDTSQSSQTYLGLHEFDPLPGSKNVFSRGISIEELSNILVRQPTRSFLLYLDACYSGNTPLAGSVAADLSNGLNYRGLIFASSSKDARSFGGQFTAALIAEFKSALPNERRSAGQFRQEVEDRLRKVAGYTEIQRPRIALGNESLPSGLINLQHAICFVTVRNLGQRGFAVTLKDPKSKAATTICDYQPPPPCFAFTLPARSWELMFQTGEKSQKFNLNLTGQFFAPLDVDLDKIAGNQVATDAVSAQKEQEFARREFNAYLDAASQAGAPLNEYVLPALQVVAANTPYVDVRPLAQDYLALNPPPGVTTDAARLIAENRPIPITSEGLAQVELLRTAKIGGNSLLSDYHLRAANAILEGQNSIVGLVDARPGSNPTDLFTYQFACGAKTAVLAGDYRAYYEKAGEIFQNASLLESVLSAKDTSYVVALDDITRQMLQSDASKLVTDDNRVNPIGLAIHHAMARTSTTSLYQNLGRQSYGFIKPLNVWDYTRLREQEEIVAKPGILPKVLNFDPAASSLPGWQSLIARQPRDPTQM
jgi:hypothetical protein